MEFQVPRGEPREDEPLWMMWITWVWSLGERPPLEKGSPQYIVGNRVMDEEEHSAVLLSLSR